jgi:hypothetical protein
MQLKLMVLIIFIGMFIGIISNAGALGEKAVASKKMLLAHYMPWYVSKPFSDKWGWHWTMNHYNPDEVQPNGQRSVASHYYPLIGPYDSGDPDALECHILLMKFAGIDGVIIDWYGIEDFYDYGVINRNTQHIINFVKKASLKFAICYEDQSIKQMINAGYISEEKAVNHEQETMRWLQKHFFDDQSYLKVDNRPVLLVFGPQYFKGNQWDQLFSVLPQRPFFYTLNSSQDGADGAFGWIPTNGATTTLDQWRGYVANLYAENTKGKTCVGIVFPQFHDIYEDAGVYKSCGFLDAQGVKTFEETFDIALKSNCEFIQIATWNDYGEGTIIEPTVEFGYSYLEIIQQQRKQEYEKSFPYSPDDLRLPITLYQLKKKYQNNQSAMEDLSKCSEQLFLGNVDNAKRLMKHIRSFNEDVPR